MLLRTANLILQKLNHLRGLIDKMNGLLEYSIENVFKIKVKICATPKFFGNYCI